MNKWKIYITSFWFSLIVFGVVSCKSSTEHKNQESVETTVTSTKDSSTLVKNERDTTKSSPKSVIPDYPYPIQPSKDNWQEDIGEVFLMLPDTIFKNEWLSGHDFDHLTHKLRKKIVQNKKISIEKMDCSIQLSKSCEKYKCNCLDKKQKQMSIVLGCYNDTTTACVLDNISKFQLNGWRKEDQSLIFTVNTGYAFFDFDHSSLFVLKSVPNGWKDVTKEFIHLTVNDFVEEAYFKNAHVKTIDDQELQKIIDSPPLYFKEGQIYSADTMRLSLHEYMLYLEFESIDKDQNKDITDYIKYDYVNLIWNGETFEKQFGKWED